MHSTLNPKQTDDPHDFLVVAPDIVLIAPADAELSSLAPDAMRYPSDPQTHIGSDFSAGIAVPPVDTFRAAAVNNVQVPGERGSIGKSAVRAFTALLLAACLGLAAIAWQSSGNVAKQIIAKWAPKFILTSLLPALENPGLAEQPSPSTVQAFAAKAAPPQPAPLAQTAPEGVAANAAALPPESAQLLHSMALDLATARQEIEQLKAKQMSRDIAKASKQNLRPKISAPPPRSAAAPARKPMPPFPPRQAAAAPTLPQAAAPSVPRQPEPQRQATAQPQAEPVPRPPMSVQ
jgi:hypothetical protein